MAEQHTISRKTAILQSIAAVIGTVVVIAIGCLAWALIDTPDSGMGSDAYQMGEQAAKDNPDDTIFYCTARNARSYMGGMPSEPEIQDWMAGCETSALHN